MAKKRKIRHPKQRKAVKDLPGSSTTEGYQLLSWRPSLKYNPRGAKGPTPSPQMEAHHMRDKSISGKTLRSWGAKKKASFTKKTKEGRKARAKLAKASWATRKRSRAERKMRNANPRLNPVRGDEAYKPVQREQRTAYSRQAAKISGRRHTTGRSIYT